MSIRYIYSLSCPETNEVRYIGQTVNIKNRFRKHLSVSNANPKTHTSCWINSLIKKGLNPIIEVVTECDVSQVDEEERFYISIFKFWGFDLTNRESGGSKNKIASFETRQKLSQSLKGKKQTEETKAKRSEKNKEAWKCEILKERQSQRSKYLNSIGKIGTKGMASKKKGLPFAGDKNKISASLKEYYKNNFPHNKFICKDLSSLIFDYEKSNLTIVQIGNKYGVNRVTITKAMKDNNIPLRNGRKKITIEKLIELRAKGMKVQEIADTIPCSVANIEKYIRLYSVYYKK